MKQLESPVMLLFFNRPEKLKRVFDVVRSLQPKKLFLVSDGARSDRPDDRPKIMQCRKVVENIDWECEVYRNYSDSNLTCDHREFTGISWCFEHTDRLIILEDDCLPEPGFLRLCDILLEKYKDNTNIHSVSGFNRVGIYESDYDYLFSKSSAGWGWATWKRVWDKAEQIKDLDFIDDLPLLEKTVYKMDKSMVKTYGDVIEQGKKIREKYRATGVIPSWEYIQGMVLILNDMLAITPTKNAVKYIGISEDATHTSASPKLLPHKIRKVLTQPSYEIKEPIRHPPEIVRDIIFEKKSRMSMYYPPYISKIESIFLRLRYGGFDTINFKKIFKERQK